MSEADMVRVRLLPTSMVVRRAEPLEPKVQRSAQLRAVASGPFENVRLAGRRLRPAPKIPLLPDLPWETSRSAYLPLSVSGYVQSSAVPRLSGAHHLLCSASSSTLRSLQSPRCRHASRPPCQKSPASRAPRSSHPLLAQAACIPVHSVCCLASRARSYLVAKLVL